MPEFVFNFENYNVNIQQKLKEELDKYNQLQQAKLNKIVNNENNEEEHVAGKVLSTIGIELESLGLSKGDAGKILKSLPSGLGENFKVVHDASTELYVYQVPLDKRKFVVINRHTNDARNLFENQYHIDTYGYEMVSVPMSRETLELSLWHLLPKLESSGDFLSERCATHIHIGIKRDLDVFKRLLKLGLWADELFYSIAGMGERFRGHSNNAIYARPLINGPYIQYERSHYQILNWEKAIKAENWDDFWAAYGINIHREAIKYHPARYFSLNLYSALLHGTLEFRYFNQCFDPALVCSVAKLCQLFTEIGMKVSDTQINNLAPGNVFQVNRPGHYLSILYKIISLGKELDCGYSISNKDITNLEEVIYKYEGIGIEDVPVMTHLKENNFDPSMIVEGELKKAKSRPIPDGHIDIHNIKNSSILHKESE